MPALTPDPDASFAAEFERHATNGAWNAFYDRPTVLDLCGDVSGRRVLDAGCGPGLLAEELVRRGAQVAAFDESEDMVQLARTRLGNSADVRQADLGQPLAWLPAASQDLAVLALVLHHLDDRVAALAELRRVLDPGGRLVVSTVHPVQDWLHLGGSYFVSEYIEEPWHEHWTLRYWRQPLERWCAEFAAAGFLIERLVEPQPAPGMAEAHPDTYAELSNAPGLIAFALRPR